MIEKVEPGIYNLTKIGIEFARNLDYNNEPEIKSILSSQLSKHTDCIEIDKIVRLEREIPRDSLIKRIGMINKIPSDRDDLLRGISTLIDLMVANNLLQENDQHLINSSEYNYPLKDPELTPNIKSHGEVIENAHSYDNQNATNNTFEAKEKLDSKSNKNENKQIKNNDGILITFSFNIKENCDPKWIKEAINSFFKGFTPILESNTSQIQ